MFVIILESTVQNNPVDDCSEEPMETSDQPQGQEYDVFGFMTPSGDSVKSSESADKIKPNKVNGTGDHKPDGKIDDKGKDSQWNEEHDNTDDVEMLDPDLTVAEELSQVQKQSPKKEDASKLKNFVMSGLDSDASRDVTSDNDNDQSEVIEVDSQSQEGTSSCAEVKKKVDGAKGMEKAMLSADSSEDVSSMETKLVSDADSPNKPKRRRTKRSLVAASPVRSSPRSKGTQKGNSLRRTVSDHAPRDLSEASECSDPAASVPSQILVEDSQQFSPSKFKAKTGLLSAESFVEESQQFSPSKTKGSRAVEETPQKLDFAGAFESSSMGGGSKNLFSQDLSSICETDFSQSQLPQTAEPPELSTPTKRPPVKGVGSPTSPVVKLYKLGQEDIIRLSPSKQATNDIGSPPRSVGRGVKLRASLLKASRAASQEKKSQDSTGGKQVNIDDIIPSSQDALTFAIENSHCIGETQFTPKMLGLDNGKDGSLSVEQSEKSKVDNESTLKDTSDMEITVIEKDKVSDKETDQMESTPKTVGSKQNGDDDTGSSNLKSGSDLLMMSNSFSESGNDSKVSSASRSGFLHSPDIVPADLDVSHESDNDSQATIVSSRVKRRKSKKVLDELKGHSEVKFI